MNKVEPSLSLRCPTHEAHIIGMLDPKPNAEKIGYCYECIAENCGNGSLPQTLRTVSTYLKDSSAFYEKCRQRVKNIGEPPAKFVEELSKEGERRENFSQHINQEKDKVRKNFDKIRKIMNQIINEKEQECLELLEKEILGLSDAYNKYQKLFRMGWPNPSDIQNLYPGIDVLGQRASQIENMDQLRAFMTGIQQDVRIQDLYFVEEDAFFRIKKKMDGLICSFSIPDCSLPKIQGKLFNSESLENFRKDLMKGFVQQEVEVENSIFTRLKASVYESKIISDTQFETLRDWVPKGYKFDLKLLYRGSADGMSSQKFHEKCDGKDATITLIKCQFDGAPSENTIGGFIDQSWHSNNHYSSSKEAFLFGLAEQSCNSVKCPILKTEVEKAFYGGSYGPVFGDGNDLYIPHGFATGTITPKSYSNAIALCNGHGKKFNCKEVEVYHVS